MSGCSYCGTHHELGMCDAYQQAVPEPTPAAAEARELTTDEVAQLHTPWSIIRLLLSQGGDIQLDHANKNYEQYARRLDAAAREREERVTEVFRDALSATPATRAGREKYAWDIAEVRKALAGPGQGFRMSRERTQALIDEINDLRQQLAASATPSGAERIDLTMRTLLLDLQNTEACWFDPNGTCQAHGWMATDRPCPQQRLRVALARVTPSAVDVAREALASRKGGANAEA